MSNGYAFAVGGKNNLVLAEIASATQRMYTYNACAVLHNVAGKQFSRTAGAIGFLLAVRFHNFAIPAQTGKHLAHLSHGVYAYAEICAFAHFNALFQLIQQSLLIFVSARYTRYEGATHFSAKVAHLPCGFRRGKIHNDVHLLRCAKVVALFNGNNRVFSLFGYFANAFAHSAFCPENCQFHFASFICAFNFFNSAVVVTVKMVKIVAKIRLRPFADFGLLL